MNRSAHRPDIRVTQGTGEVTKLGSKKSSSSSTSLTNNVTLPPSFRSPTWTTNRTQTPYNSNNNTSSISPSASPSSTSRRERERERDGNLSSKDLTNYNTYNNTSNNINNNTNQFSSSFGDGMTRGGRPSSAGANGFTKTTEKEYIQNLQQQIQVLELQSKYLQDRDTTRGADEDIDDTDLASIGKHMALLRKKCISLEQGSKAKVDELELQKEEFEKKAVYSEHMLDSANEEKGYLKREIERIQMDHQEERDKLLDDVISAQRETEKHVRTITSLEQNRDRLMAEKDKLRNQLSISEAEKLKVEAARDTAIKAEKSSQKREEDLMTKVSELQTQLDVLKDVKQQITRIEQQARDSIKQATDEKWVGELKLKQLESSLDQAVQSKTKLENDCKLHIDETTRLRATIDNLQRELRTEQQKLQSKNSEVVSKSESEGVALQKANQLFQKWKESTEKVANLQTRIEELTLELQKTKQEVEFHKEEEEHLKRESARQAAEHLQIEVESLNARKEGLSLRAEVARLQADVDTQGLRTQELSKENSQLQANLDVLQTRVAVQREIDKSFTPEELEQMRSSNLQMADKVSKLAQKISTITGTTTSSSAM